MDWYAMSTTRIETEIGLRIKHRRLKQNITQLELGIKTGLSRVAISKIERGFGASLSSLIEIFRALYLLQNLELVFPKDELSPIELIKLKGRKRKRSSSRNKLIATTLQAQSNGVTPQFIAITQG